MSRKANLIIIALAIFSLIPAFCLFAEAPAVEYLCEFGISLYKMGKYDEALTEFKKALIADPGNAVAQAYTNEIFNQYPSNLVVAQEGIAERQPARPMPKKELTRDEAMNATLDDLKKGMPEAGEKEGIKVAGINVSGEIQASLGASSSDGFLWNRADGNLNEENYRVLSDVAYNRKSNTFDPRIYDRLRVNLDKEGEEGFAFHGNVTIDPWSYLSKSEKVNAVGTSGDNVQIELKGWSNSAYTISENFFTTAKGDAFSPDEMKIVKNRVDPFTVVSLNSNIFNFGQVKLYPYFNPLRELWFDYKHEGLDFRVFPLAYEDQALTSDDPLHLSNNHIWWQESPWIRKWQPGVMNRELSPVDFTTSSFDNTIAYLARDSDGKRLTSLRGFSFDFSPSNVEGLSIKNTFATPKDPWQDYSDYDNISNALRLKYSILDNLSVGTVYTFRDGFDSAQRRDLVNHVLGFDFGYEIMDGLKFNAELATSRKKKDLTFPEFETKTRGNAVYFSLVGRWPRTSIMELENGYDQIKRDKEEPNFSKFRFFGSHMDNGFDSTLADYHETRDDAFWSRHIQFKKPFQYYYSGLYYPGSSWDDIEPYRIGNGIDVGRDVLGLRVETSLGDGWADNLFDVRNVHSAEGKFIENVIRDEFTYKVSDRLTAKVLGLYQKLPKTKKGVDPFITSSDTGEASLNADMPDGMNPSLKTGSLGLEYAVTDKVSLTGVWERTNDYTLAYDNYPRGNLTSSTFVTDYLYDKRYRSLANYLYSQTLFPMPPYSFYNIWKTGLRIMPMDKLELYLDYTRNEFKSAGQIDDNMNHIGFEATYMPTKKFGLSLKYTYSRLNDLTRMLDGYDKYYLGHHNFFTEFRYMPTIEEELVLQYGEAGRSNVYTKYADPFSTGTPTLDTRHIIRLYYRRKF